ncbi:PAS domain-containing protein [Pigmentiphaga aceris]|uniref:histidine kinase n=1 Tax=Pigmentiphaga aceris TaxID=1940612 RepID=A0A5C0AWD4_9BURK|nr:ATP-binding protein [Pigmentiphaga aceris]QEI06699.1 PAS domain-containing protein [Pigmentiphaga aceris]
MNDLPNSPLVILLAATALCSLLMWRWMAHLRLRLVEANTERDMFLRAAEGSPSPMLITGADRRVTWANSAFEGLCGYRLHELQGRSPGEMLHGKDTDQDTVALIRHQLARNEVAAAEILNYGRSGRAYWVKLHITPILNAEGEVVRYIAVFNETTERRRLLEQLHHGQQELERRVAQRTRELLAAKESADIANSTKSEFLGRMSQQLRTPMHAVLAYNNLALERVERDLKLRQYLVNLQNAGTGLLRLLNELFDVSQLEAGRVNLSLRETRLYDVVQSTVDAWREDAPLTAARIRLDMIGPSPAVVADADRLAQVVRNLLSNALRYSGDESPVYIMIDVTDDDGVDTYARLTVRDAGIGIPPEEMGRLFNGFYRSSRTVTEELAAATGKRGSGVGIGLAACRHIVDLHNGHIRAWNNEDHGSTFEVLLPLVTMALVV